jgi:hypothetical protein
MGMPVQVGKEEEHRSKEGFFVTFVADLKPEWAPADVAPAPIAASRPLPSQAPQQIPSMRYVATAISTVFRRVRNALLKLVLAAVNCPEATAAWGISHAERGLVGVIVFDTLAFHVPAVWLGKNKWQRRHNIAYISNVAIAPGCRRCDAALLSPLSTKSGLLA